MTRKAFACEVEAGRHSGRRLRPTVSLLTWLTARLYLRHAGLSPAGGEFTMGIRSSSWRSSQAGDPPIGRHVPPQSPYLAIPGG